MKKSILRACVVALFLSLITIKVSAQELKSIELQEPDMNSGKLLMHALKERRSARSFSERELPLDVLSNLLWAAFGENRSDSGKRTAPSAHNAQEIDVYVAMKSGLYLYDAKDHVLDQVLVKDIRKVVGKQSFTDTAPVNLIFVSEFKRLEKVSSDEKVFYSATDTGFISQNVYLYCASEGLSTVVLGWVDKPVLSKAMGLSESQFVILAQSVGYPQ